MVQALSSSLFRSLALAAIMLCALLAPAHAEDTTSNPAAKLVDGLGKQALDLLADSSVTHEQRQARFKKMLNDNFDVEHIGRFVLGRYWKQATPDQQKEYQSLFDQWIVIVYTDRLENYSGETFTVASSRPDGPGTLVKSVIKPKEGPPVDVDWRVETKDGKPRIMDVVVEGISMLVSQRDEFGSIITDHNNDIGALISMLKKRIENPDEPSQIEANPGKDK